MQNLTDRRGDHRSRIVIWRQDRLHCSTATRSRISPPLGAVRHNARRYALNRTAPKQDGLESYARAKSALRFHHRTHLPQTCTEIVPIQAVKICRRCLPNARSLAEADIHAMAGPMGSLQAVPYQPFYTKDTSRPICGNAPSVRNYSTPACDLSVSKPEFCSINVSDGVCTLQISPWWHSFLCLWESQSFAGL